MQPVQAVLPYGCHFLDNSSNHIIGLRYMRGHGALQRRFDATAHIYGTCSLTGNENKNTVP